MNREEFEQEMQLIPTLTDLKIKERRNEKKVEFSFKNGTRIVFDGDYEFEDISEMMVNFKEAGE